MAGTARDGGAQNVSEHAQTPPRLLHELYQESECVKTPVFYQQKITTTKLTIEGLSFCRGETTTF